jgi:hypothetical protein
MPIVRQPARCRAPNAFRVRHAVWQLFLDQSLPVHQPWRSFIAIPSSPQTADVTALTKEDAPASHVEGEDLKIRFHMMAQKPDLPRPGSNLAAALEKTRNKNRDSLIRKLNPGSEGHEVQFKRPDHPEFKSRPNALARTKDDPELGSKKSHGANPTRLRSASKKYKEIKKAAEVEEIDPLGLLAVARRWSRFEASQGRKVASPSHESNTTRQEEDTVQEKPSLKRWEQLLLDKQANMTTMDILEYEGKYVLPTVNNNTQAKDFPWMKGQEDVWGPDRSVHLTCFCGISAQ